VGYNCPRNRNECGNSEKSLAHQAPKLQTKGLGQEKGLLRPKLPKRRLHLACRENKSVLGFSILVTGENGGKEEEGEFPLTGNGFRQPETAREGAYFTPGVRDFRIAKEPHSAVKKISNSCHDTKKGETSSYSTSGAWALWRRPGFSNGARWCLPCNS